jgi:hypothetical protein
MTVVVVCGSVVALAVEVVLLAALISAVIERKGRQTAGPIEPEVTTGDEVA